MDDSWDNQCLWNAQVHVIPDQDSDVPIMTSVQPNCNHEI